MAKLTHLRPLSQADAKQYRKVVADKRIALPWRLQPAGSVLPCDGSELYQPQCGVACGSRVLSIVRGESECPMNRPTGCPFRQTPD
jgi:hypothetical protein